MALLFLLALTLLAARANAGAALADTAPPLFSAAPLPEQRCASAVPVAGLNLTAAERELLPYICWPEGNVDERAQPTGGLQALRRTGVPAGVNCTVVQRCEGDSCVDVCARGSVWVDPWLAHAIRQQTRLVQTLPLCYATLLGTHNSAISLADGYGVLDEYFQGFFKYIKWALHDFSGAPLNTANQLLSLTDQLNLGVRSVELDTHWVGGVLRIAHCGGFHVPALNKIVAALNFVLKLLHKNIRWDTETLGCSPSLSSIPSGDQRTLTDAMQEVKDWMDAPGNGDEFVILYFDDQANLQTWGVVGRLLDDVLSIFPRDWIYGTDDLADAGGSWPTQQQMLKSGKRVLFVSGTDYGAEMQPLVFSRDATLCGWNEPPLASLDGVPACQVNADVIEPRPMFDGLLTRVISCELQYGPLSCEFVWKGSNEPVWDEFTLPPVIGCGLNMPSPDLLVPVRAAAAIWTWAPGHPYDTTLSQDARLEARKLSMISSTMSSSSSPAGAAAAAAAGAAGAAAGGSVAAPVTNCGVLSASDGRWRAVPCAMPELPSACRQTDAGLDAAGGGWVLDASLPRGSCPPGTQYDLPRHPRENYLLAAALQGAGHEAAWLPVHGPDWSTAGWPAERQQPQPTNRRRVLLHGALPAAGAAAALALVVTAAVAGRRLVLQRYHREPLYQALDAE